MTTAWEPVIGLEIHVQLKTKTKMFCRCANGFGGAGRTRRPAPSAWRSRARYRCRTAARSRRRSSWASRSARPSPTGRSSTARATSTPTIPRPTRSPSTTSPLCTGGRLIVPTAEGDVVVRIHRAHLEEDAAKNVHVAASGRIHGATATLVDFNRGGTPLLEIVTEPDIHSSDVAKRFLQLLRQTVVELGVSDAELEKGSMRFDVNVSVRPAGSDELRTRTELKNMNSFNFAAKGIEKEIARQIGIYEAGGTGRAGDAALRSGQRGVAAAALEGGSRGLPLLPGARPRAGAAAAGARRAPAQRNGGAAERQDQADRATRCPSTTRTCSSPAASTCFGRRSSRPAPIRKRLRTCSRTSSWRPASIRPR